MARGRECSHSLFGRSPEPKELDHQSDTGGYVPKEAIQEPGGTLERVVPWKPEEEISRRGCCLLS